MLYPGSRFRMADDLSETYIRQLLESQAGPEVIVGWQGGEATVMGLSSSSGRSSTSGSTAPEQQVTYTIRPTARGLNDEWARSSRGRASSWG